ncbi:unnamed protein product [Cylindrotheca closterium]|uniref:Uncharacterized protein n=1 Tax=Cylindrotheca closterium TaxID=2856 RepID=A0AAD2GD59_9STRA|nr:unnamed protein product [Cylindrotheca closterium]
MSSVTATSPKKDPLFEQMMTPSTGENVQDLPLHNYYSEFRLGQGDPLLKSSMEGWSCTTVDGKETKKPQKEVLHLDHGENSNVLAFPAASAVGFPNETALAAPLQSPASLLQK